MNEYFNKIEEEIKEYFNVLSTGIPDFINDYIVTPELVRIGKIDMQCGTYYTKIFHNKYFYTNLEHSIGVALIIWNFTKDKKQTLAGLFHDIATPVFKHCIDFLHKDYEKQETTEEKTTQIIKNSREITSLLKRDGILLEEVSNYKAYPIADNDTPRLSADRLEYTLSNGINFKQIWTVDEIKTIYQNIKILKNEDEKEELGFQDKNIAEYFIRKASILWPLWVDNKDKIVMQFIADIVRFMIEGGYITAEELYECSEEEIVYKIENCKNKKLANAFKKFREATKIGESEIFMEDKYCVSVNSKRRYVDPLVQIGNENKRISEISKEADRHIQNYLNFKTMKYAYLDFKIE